MFIDLINDVKKDLVIKSELPTITTVDEFGNDNIVMVDVKAAAGYVTRHLEPSYMQSLQAFKLPGPQFRNASYRAFEVSGDSMFDTLYHGDWVICQHVDGFSNIRDGYIHVIVTHEEVMVKRILNRVEKRQKLILQSDNEAYPPRELDAAEVQEIWLVKCFMGFNMPNRRIEVKKVLNDIQVKLLEHESRMSRLEKKK
jgi:phage repressor protein C with HTH and peptisase S24 domain